MDGKLTAIEHILKWQKQDPSLYVVDDPDPFLLCVVLPAKKIVKTIRFVQPSPGGSASIIV